MWSISQTVKVMTVLSSKFSHSDHFFHVRFLTFGSHLDFYRECRIGLNTDMDAISMFMIAFSQMMKEYR